MAKTKKKADQDFLDDPDFWEELDQEVMTSLGLNEEDEDGDEEE